MVDEAELLTTSALPLRTSVVALASLKEVTSPTIVTIAARRVIEFGTAVKRMRT